jgi:putative glycosyl hydrolase-like family 15 (GHL15) protein
MRRGVQIAVAALWGVLALTLPASSLASTGAAGHLLVATDTAADFSNLSLTAQRQHVVVLQPWQTDELQRIKAANPSATVVCHKNLPGATSSVHGPTGLYSSGVSYAEAEDHPDWFLKDSHGSRITFDGYGWLYAMDIGSRSYQQAWANNVIDELQENGWDGVLMDNTDTTMKYDFANYPVKYPADSRWQAGIESALAYIGPRIQAAGKLAVPNIGAWGGSPSIGNSWLQYVSGAMDEMFVKWGSTAGSGYADESRWNAQLDSLKYAQQHGKQFLAVTHSSSHDAAAARYGWATLLLGARARADYAMAPDYTTETWFPEYDYDIGDPTGPESTDASGVHRRVFTNGIAVVNPTSSQLTANLGGTYSGSGLSQVSRVTLAPHSGYVLTGSASGDGSLGDSTTTTTVTHTPRRGAGKVKGAVSGSAKVATASTLSGGQVRLRLFRNHAGHWRSVRAARTTRLSADGRFGEGLRGFGGPRLRPGTYRVRARYLGSGSAKPSTSPFRKFQLRG